jgi:hypothetical protein
MEWQWTWETILTLVGLAVSVGFGIGIFQMVGGAPKLIPIFESKDRPESRTLVFGLQNAPIKSKLLRMLRVYRQDAEITLAFKVRDLVSDQMVYVTKPLVESGEERTRPTTTVRSPWFAGASILLHMDEARILSADSDNAVALRPIRSRNSGDFE